MLNRQRFLGNGAHLTEESTALYVDALKRGKVYLLPGIILRHVEECERCKLEIIEARSLMEQGGDHDLEAIPYFIPGSKHALAGFSVVYRVAAVFVVGAGICAMFFLLRSGEGSRVSVADSTMTTQATRLKTEDGLLNEQRLSDKHKFLSDNFSESPNLENLVNSGLRSESPVVVSPTNNATLSQGIMFEWEADGTDWVSVTILSNREEVLENVRLKQSKFLYLGEAQTGAVLLEAATQ